MNEHQDLARAYLTPPENSFWKWADDGEVVAWASDGATIAFRQELAQILASQVSQGLPELGPLLLVLSATREKWPVQLTELLREGALVPWPKCVSRAQLESIMDSLANVHSVKEDLRTTFVAKITLVDTVFGENRRNCLKSGAATAVIEILRLGLDETITKPLSEFLTEHLRTLVLSTADPLPALPPLFQDLLKMEAGLKEVTEERLRARRRTGLDELLVAPELEIEIPPSKKIRSLLAELQDDTELGGVASIAKTLMAAVSLPRRVELEHDISSGGVSDITNRGALDRLLLSELANDDLTLAVRVAVNEALYLRRESPPESPPQHRLMILDCGIHSWGTPRVFGTAVALAMIATSQSTSSFACVTPNDADLEDVDLYSREGLLDQLARLSPDLHPGAALPAIARYMVEHEIDCEAIFVTTEDVLNDPDFRGMLDQSTLASLFVATVTRQGEYTLFHRSIQGMKRLQRAVIDPAKLLPTRSKILTDVRNVKDLPAIFGVSPFPLLVPHSIKSNAVWRICSSHYLATSNDRRLTLWTNTHRGPAQLAERIPPGNVWWHGTCPRLNMAYAVIGALSENGLILVQIDLEGLNCNRRVLDIKRGPKAICSFHDTLFAIHAGHVTIIDKNTASAIRTLDLPQRFTWKHDRFFFHAMNNEWYALSTDGFSARFEQVPMVGASNDLLTMLEVEGVEGPIGISTHGAVIYTGDREEIPFDVERCYSPFSKARIINNRYVILESHHHNASLAIDVAHKLPMGSEGQLWRQLDQKMNALFSPRNVRKRFRSIFIDDSKDIVLVSNKGSQLRIHLANGGNICASPTHRRDLPRDTKKFVNIDYAEADFELSAANWEDGSQAFLDSRGLLHLKSSDLSIPEVSIVLRDGSLAGWTSDGIHWGNRYYVRTNSGSERQAFEHIARFAEICQAAGRRAAETHHEH